MSDAAADAQWRVLARKGNDTFRVALGRLEDEVVAAEPLSSILVLGPPGSGKTTGMVVPTILEWPGPAVVISVAGEAVEQTIDVRRGMGDVFVVDPHDFLPAWSIKTGWNPLDEIESWNDAQKMSARLLATKVSGLNDRDFWHQAAVRLLAPHLYAAAKNRHTMADVVRWILTNEEFEVRSLLQAAGNEEAISAAEASWQREERARSSVYTTLEIHMSAWDDERVQRWSASESQLKLTRFLNGTANTLYLCIPAAVGNELASLSVTLIKDLLNRLAIVNRGFASHLVGSEGIISALESSPASTTPLLLILDDAADTAPMADLKTLANTASKNAIQLVTVFNDLSEMRTVVGADASQAVVNNHPACVIMPGMRDLATLDYVTGVYRGDSLYGSDDKEVTNLTARRVPKGKALCLYQNLPPFMLSIRFTLTEGEQPKSCQRRSID